MRSSLRAAISRAYGVSESAAMRCPFRGRTAAGGAAVGRQHGLGLVQDCLVAGLPLLRGHVAVALDEPGHVAGDPEVETLLSRPPPGLAREIKGLALAGTKALVTETASGARGRLGAAVDRCSCTRAAGGYGSPRVAALRVYEHGSIAADVAAARAEYTCGSSVPPLAGCYGCSG
jgi:hypothetical protein